MSIERNKSVENFLQHIVSVVRQDCYAAFTGIKGNAYRRISGQITDGVIASHLSNAQPVAVYPVLGEQVSIAVLDFDVHNGELTWSDTISRILPVLTCLSERGYCAVPFRSGGGSGVHIWILFERAQDAKQVREMLSDVLQQTGLSEGTEGIAQGQVEIYPKQNQVPEGGYGNAIALPLARNSVPLDDELQPITASEAWRLPLNELLSPDVPQQEATKPSDRDEPESLGDIPNVVLAGDDEEVCVALKSIPADDYDTWVRVGFALKASFGDTGYTLWDEWSQSSNKYPGREEARDKWDSFPRIGQVGIGTLFHLARQNGWNGPSDPIIRQMNAKYGHLTHKNASQIILKDHAEGSPEAFNYLSRDAFRDRLKADKVEVEGVDGKVKRIPIADYWLGHPKRSQYHRVIFDPSRPPGENGTAWNVWSDFGVTACSGGSWEKFKTHLRYVVCGGDERLFLWLLNWMALGVQEPGLVIGTVPLFIGAPGTGKGIIARAYAKLWGKHATTVTHKEQVAGRFGGHFFGIRFVFLDEAMFGGDRSVIGVIKTRITEPYIQMERKGVDAQIMENHMIFMAASNELHAVAADIGDRRWQVFMIGDDHREDHAYFAAIQKELEEGGYEAMLYDLQHMDISVGPDPRRTIKTEGLFDQMQLSAPPSFRYVYDLLCTGQLPQSDAPGNGPGRTTVAAMLEDLKAQESAQYETRVSLGKFIKGAIPGIKTQANGTFIVKRAGAHNPGEKTHSTRYHFPPLQEARRQFEAYAGVPISWPAFPTEWLDERPNPTRDDNGDLPF